MGHNITAVILKGDFDKDIAGEFGLFAKYLGFNLNLFHIDFWYAFWWQYRLETEGELETVNVDCIGFPCDMSIDEIIKRISKIESPEYAIILTDYFGGIGFQCANVFKDAANADKNVSMINEALRYLGVKAKEGLDEFDTVGLDRIRVQPESLKKYRELCDEHGIS